MKSYSHVYIINPESKFELNFIFLMKSNFDQFGPTHLVSFILLKHREVFGIYSYNQSHKSQSMSKDMATTTTFNSLTSIFFLTLIIIIIKGIYLLSLLSFFSIPTQFHQTLFQFHHDFFHFQVLVTVP